MKKRVKGHRGEVETFKKLMLRVKGLLTALLLEIMMKCPLQAG